MTSIDDPYQFSMDDSSTEMPRTRSSSRTRKPTNRKAIEKRVNTRSSQKSGLPDENNQSFMSNINTGFSQFVNSKKRQREEKKTKTLKRAKVTTENEENQPPNDIEQVKLVYETAAGRTNLTRAAATNAQILANRTGSKSNTTYTVNAIEDTQIDVIPDTLVDIHQSPNDSSWQRDIDRLMKKLEEPSPSLKTPTQIEETQMAEQEETIYPSQTGNIHPQITQPPTTTTNTIQRETIAIQTENTPSSIHHCCQDVSTCPCVLKYSQLEKLFMEKMSRFISIVPTIPNTTTETENAPKRRPVSHGSRFRRFRAYRRINHRIPPKPDQSTTLEEFSDEPTTPPEIEHPPIIPTEEPPNNPHENIMSTTVTIEKNPTAIGDLSAIEKLDTTTTTMVDYPSTLMISSTDDTCSTNRSLVLTTSSLDETQKNQFRLFLTRFNLSSSSLVDSSTTHIIVNDQTPLICPLTGKIIQGIARHVFIVSYRWLNECLTENCLVDERPYEIRGDTSLGHDHGGMRRSRLTPSFLLQNYSICLRCAPGDCVPLQDVEQIQELIEICGGRLVKSFGEIRTLDNQRQMVLIFGPNGIGGGDEKRQMILERCQQFHVRCVNIHWLLISIAKFDVQPLDNYDLNQ